MTAPSSAIELHDVTAGYGETVVLERLQLRLERGASLSVLGRNGVGKTTLLATLMGLAYVPQGREVFPSLTVQENLAVAARPGRWDLQTVYETFPRLRERRGNYGDQLSGGEQQMLAIGRALVGNPTVLLLDEPSEGLAPVIVQELHAVLVRLRREQSVSMVLVEQKAPLALAFAERCIVMDRGGIAYDGATAQLQADAAQLNRLLGVAG